VVDISTMHDVIVPADLSRSRSFDTTTNAFITPQTMKYTPMTGK
jgi:hypothetical protein